MKDHRGDEREERKNAGSPCGGSFLLSMESQDSSRMNEAGKEREKVFFRENRKRI
jgi:hypothetical protein